MKIKGHSGFTEEISQKVSKLYTMKALLSHL